MSTQTKQNLVLCGWIIAIIVLLTVAVRVVAGGMEESPQLKIDVELLDSVHCWCSPLWGHNASKVVEGKSGEVWVALFSGAYPESNVQIFKKLPGGQWQKGGILAGAYQPSMLFVDASGRLNVVQNSQTKPITHLRATDDEGLSSFAPVATGNGLPDGRGWYVGIGIHDDVMYMAYITLDYNLFLTRKRILDTSWAPAVMLHQGSVNLTTGNHSWTRPDFQFDDRQGYLVVNETSDGSVKNTYNAVHLISFDLADPHQFHTEEITRVPQGFAAYSPDFVITPDGGMHCVVMWGSRRYDSASNLDGDPGLYVYSLPSKGARWISRRVFDTPTDCGLVLARDGSVMAVRVVQGEGKGVVEVMRSVDRGATWSQLTAQKTKERFLDLSHLQFATSGSNWGARSGSVGIFQDRWGKLGETKNPPYGIYILQVTER